MMSDKGQEVGDMNPGWKCDSDDVWQAEVIHSMMFRGTQNTTENVYMRVNLCHLELSEHETFTEQLYVLFLFFVGLDFH